MKKCILFLFAVLVCAMSHGQMLRFTESTNKWVEFHWEGPSYPIYYNSDTIIGGFTYQKTSHLYCVREDTVVKKVYARLMQATSFTDTTEHVLYDYNLQLGDTVTDFVDTFSLKRYVCEIDSFNYNNTWYKMWTFCSANSYAHHHSVVEGLGCINQLFTPIFPLSYVEGLPYLVCFTTLGMNPAINIPPNFINPANCALSVKKTSAQQTKISIPNPANTTTTIKIPRAYHNGHIIIYDAMGRKCASIHLSEEKNVPFANGLATAGMYYYVIASVNNDYIQKGVFIFAP